MCGKFTQKPAWATLVAYPDIAAASESEPETITPMRFATVVTLDDEGLRRAVKMRWGMVSARAPDPMSGSKHIHARAETIDALPTFREAFARRRGLVAVSTFNEGKEITPTKTEQHTITPKDGKPLAIAVVWERWTNRAVGELLTFAMVTVPANHLITTITDRMPAVIREADWSRWLGEEPVSADTLKSLLRPYEGDWEMRAQEKTRPPPRPKRNNSQAELF